MISTLIMLGHWVRRELRGGWAGLRLLALCLFLAVFALASVDSLSTAMQHSLRDQGQSILGGDIEISMAQRSATPSEVAALQAAGRVSHLVRLRAMVQVPRSGDSRLVELTAIDTAYPLYGTLQIQGTRPRAGEVALATSLAQTLGLRVGDEVQLGAASLRVSGLIVQEPDRVGQGFAFGASALIDSPTLARTQLVQPGSLYTSLYRVALAQPAQAAAVAQKWREDYAALGWQVRDSRNAAPGLQRFITRLGQFLSLVALSALVVAGVGVGNGVSAYLQRRASTMATLKILGADHTQVSALYGLLLFSVALVAIGAGLVAGAAVPFVVRALAADALPILPALDIYPAALLRASLYALLMTGLFTILPLARVRHVCAAYVLRDTQDMSPPVSWRVYALMGMLGFLVAGLAIGFAANRRDAALFLAAVLGLLLLLSALGWLVRWTAARWPRPRGLLMRLALGNMHRPGAQTGQLVVALGLGLTIFILLASVQNSLTREIELRIPERAPRFFVLDIPSDSLADFQTRVMEVAPQARLTSVPALRGPIVAVKGVRVADMKKLPPGAWILRGDRGLTYARDLPKGSDIVAGQWWPPSYQGPPLVSLDAESARALDVRVGDMLSVAIMGVEVQARVASLRRIQWDNMGFNFAMVFSPGLLEAAPHSHMATIEMGPARAQAVQRAISAAYPSVSIIAVADVVRQVSDLLGQMATAVRIGAGLVVAAGLAVLVGALASARHVRQREAVLLKLLGGSRGQLLGAQALEYALLGTLVAAVALLLGTVGGYYTVVSLLEMPWAPDWTQLLGLVLASVGITMGLGLVSGLRLLGVRVGRALRDANA